MGYRISAHIKGGGALSVIVSDTAMAIAQIEAYREDGFVDILVKDMDGRDITIEELTALNNPPSD